MKKTYEVNFYTRCRGDSTKLDGIQFVETPQKGNLVYLKELEDSDRKKHLSCTCTGVVENVLMVSGSSVIHLFVKETDPYGNSVV